MDGYVTLAEAAEWLACSTRTITRKLDAGELTGVKLHNRWYIAETSVEEYLSTMTPDELAVLDARRLEIAFAKDRAAAPDRKCPNCGNRIAWDSDMGLYHCYQCGKYFRSLDGDEQ